MVPKLVFFSFQELYRVNFMLHSFHFIFLYIIIYFKGNDRFAEILAVNI